MWNVTKIEIEKQKIDFCIIQAFLLDTVHDKTSRCCSSGSMIAVAKAL